MTETIQDLKRNKQGKTGIDGIYQIAAPIMAKRISRMKTQRSTVQLLDFKKIIRMWHEIILEDIYDGGKVPMPGSLGDIQIVKMKPTKFHPKIVKYNPQTNKREFLDVDLSKNKGYIFFPYWHKTQWWDYRIHLANKYMKKMSRAFCEGADYQDMTPQE